MSTLSAHSDYAALHKGDEAVASLTSLAVTRGSMLEMSSPSKQIPFDLMPDRHNKPNKYGRLKLDAI